MLNKGLAGATQKEKQSLKKEIESIGKTIQENRIKQNFTQESFAEALDISVPTIKGIEQGIRVPSLGMLLRILAFLKLEIKLVNRN